VGEEHFVALPTLKLALLAQHVKEPANGPSQQPKNNYSEREVERLSHLCSLFSFVAVRALNFHAVTPPSLCFTTPARKSHPNAVSPALPASRNRLDPPHNEQNHGTNMRRIIC